MNNAVEILILVFSCIGVGYYCGISDAEKEAQTPQPSIHTPNQVSTPNTLTVDDLKVIYACVDTKISNNNNKDKLGFPCMSVRGDSF